MGIDSLTEEQAKNLIKFIGKKANGDLCIKLTDLMFKPATGWTYFCVGCENDGIEPDYFSIKLACKEPYKKMLKQMFNMTCKLHRSLTMPGIEPQVEVMPKDKTLEEWLIEMELES